MKFSVESQIEGFTAKIAGRLSKRLSEARPWLENRIRRKFSRDARPATSNPGTYPKKLRGHLHDGITVSYMRGFLGLRRTGLRVHVEGDKARQRYFRLEKGDSWSPKKQGGRLAIPVSLLARKMASNGLGPRKFPYKLQLTKAKVRGKKMSVLMTQTSAVTRKIKGTDSPQGTIHYVLVRHARIKPRRNLVEAVEAEMPALTNFLLKKIE